MPRAGKPVICNKLRLQRHRRRRADDLREPAHPGVVETQPPFNPIHGDRCHVLYPQTRSHHAPSGASLARQGHPAQFRRYCRSAASRGNGEIAGEAGGGGSGCLAANRSGGAGNHEFGRHRLAADDTRFVKPKRDSAFERSGDATARRDPRYSRPAASRRFSRQCVTARAGLQALWPLPMNPRLRHREARAAMQP